MVASSGQQIADGTGPTFTFTPGNAGTYTVTFTVIDPNVGWDRPTSVITSLDVPPVLTAPTASQSAYAGVSTSINLGTLAVKGVGPFTDTIHWGDGQTSTFSPRPPGPSPWPILMRRRGPTRSPRPSPSTTVARRPPGSRSA